MFSGAAPRPRAPRRAPPVPAAAPLRATTHALQIAGVNYRTWLTSPKTRDKVLQHCLRLASIRSYQHAQGLALWFWL